MKEFIKIDSSGRVIKTFLYPAYADQFGINEFTHIEGQLKK